MANNGVRCVIFIAIHMRSEERHQNREVCSSQPVYLQSIARPRAMDMEAGVGEEEGGAMTAIGTPVRIYFTLAESPI